MFKGSQKKVNLSIEFNIYTKQLYEVPVFYIYLLQACNSNKSNKRASKVTDFNNNKIKNIFIYFFKMKID